MSLMCGVIYRCPWWGGGFCPTCNLFSLDSRSGRDTVCAWSAPSVAARPRALWDRHNTHNRGDKRSAYHFPASCSCKAIPVVVALGKVAEGIGPELLLAGDDEEVVRDHFVHLADLLWAQHICIPPLPSVSESHSAQEGVGSIGCWYPERLWSRDQSRDCERSGGSRLVAVALPSSPSCQSMMGYG